MLHASNLVVLLATQCGRASCSAPLQLLCSTAMHMHFGCCAGMGLAQDVQALSDLQLYESLNAPCQEDPTSFLTLTACSWEQDVSCLKVYIPLRGVHNEMIRTHFTRHSAEVRHTPPGP